MVYRAISLCCGWIYLSVGRLRRNIPNRARIITKIQCAYQPVSPSIGYIPFASHMFVGDAMIIAVGFPKRIAQSVIAFGCSRDTVSRQWSVIDTKKIDDEWESE